MSKIALFAVQLDFLLIDFLSFHVDDIFDTDGNAVQGTSNEATLCFLGTFAGYVQRAFAIHFAPSLHR